MASGLYYGDQGSRSPISLTARDILSSSAVLNASPLPNRIKHYLANMLGTLKFVGGHLTAPRRH